MRQRFGLEPPDYEDGETARQAHQDGTSPDDYADWIATKYGLSTDFRAGDRL